MSVIIQHPDLATMTIRSERMREFARDAGLSVSLASEVGETTAITHHPDGRIEIHTDGDGQAVAAEINATGAWPDNVVSS